MVWKNNTILIWQGVSISNALKGDIYHLTRVIIQIATLSRSTHTAVLKKYKDKYYLLQSNLLKGVHIVEVYEPWLKNQLKDKKIFYIETNKRLKRKEYDDMIKSMYESGQKYVKIANYSIVGVINQFFINVFNRSPLQNSTPRQKGKMFCSELTNWYFTKEEKSFRYSPYDVLRKYKMNTPNNVKE